MVNFAIGVVEAASSSLVTSTSIRLLGKTDMQFALKIRGRGLALRSGGTKT